MSQIQIRKIPINDHQMTGSWFPSGYYGHFRAKSRADLSNQFRELARPNPPKRFLKRQHSEASSHSFSQHDNRFKFENDPLVRCTQAGFGKRKSETNSRGEFDPFFIGWIPKNVDRNKFIDNTEISSYADDYSGISTSPRILTDSRLMTPSPSLEGTVYSSTYAHGQPDHEQAKQIRQETFQRYSTTQTRRTQLQQNDRSFNVASCLVWNGTEHEKNENTKINIKPKNLLAPTSIKSRHSFHEISSSDQPKLYHSQSIQTFKTKEQPYVNTTPSEDRYKFTVTLSPRPRASSSFELSHANSMECLISKYM